MGEISIQAGLHSPIASLSPDLQSRLASTLPKHVHSRLLRAPEKHDSQRLLFSMAGSLSRAGLEEWERILVLEAWFEGYYRPIGRREIERAVTRATGRISSDAPRWPDLNRNLVSRVTRVSSGGLVELRRLSEADSDTLPTDSVLDRLFLPSDFICLAKCPARAVTDKREVFRGRASEFQFIVPNPMTAAKGFTSEGKISSRCLANVGPTTYQVIEFDQGDLDQQAKLHRHLATMVPLRLVVFSGNKSLHGWYDVRRLQGEDITRFRRYAASLGADKATFVPCQLVRTPNALRENGARQSVMYLSLK